VARYGRCGALAHYFTFKIRDKTYKHNFLPFHIIVNEIRGDQEVPQVCRPSRFGLEWSIYLPLSSFDAQSVWK
jgi:hypothetical protein